MNASYNSFRTFAFFAVFLYHIRLSQAGYLGVQAFFVLSGFLITPILVQTKEENKTFLAYIKNFLLRRTLRIFPLYYFYLLALLATIAIFGLTKLEYFASLKSQLGYGFTYTYNFFHSTVFYNHNEFISHFWSLAVEEQFYLIWPLLIFLTKPARLKTVLLSIIVAGPVIRFLLGYYIDHNAPAYLTQDKILFVYLNTFSYLDAFSIGGFFALYQHRVVRSSEVFITLGGTVLLGLGLNYLVNHKLDISTMGYPPLMKDGMRYIWGYTLLNYCFALVLHKLKTRDFLTFIFENKILNSLGKISYGLYVYHYGMIHIAHDIGKYYGLMDKPVLKLAVNMGALGATIAISYVSFYFFENKFIRLKDIIAPKHVAPAPAAAEASVQPA